MVIADHIPSALATLSSAAFSTILWNAESSEEKADALVQKSAIDDTGESQIETPREWKLDGGD